ncbi:MAG: hypothetical protein JWM07_765 [Candidatus Saccharibacteria bacterium]|nr:hypothetical protein [Candidatus Saccharibacteria bacterium]
MNKPLSKDVITPEVAERVLMTLFATSGPTNYISAIELILDSIPEMLLQETCMVSLNVNN